MTFFLLVAQRNHVFFSQFGAHFIFAEITANERVFNALLSRSQAILSFIHHKIIIWLPKRRWFAFKAFAYFSLLQKRRKKINTKLQQYSQHTIVGMHVKLLACTSKMKKYSQKRMANLVHTNRQMHEQILLIIIYVCASGLKKKHQNARIVDWCRLRKIRHKVKKNEMVHCVFCEKLYLQVGNED